MTDKKSRSLEKHLSEIRKRAYYNLILTLTGALLLGLLLGVPLEFTLNLFLDEVQAVSVSMIAIGLIAIAYGTPLIHFRETNSIESKKSPSYFLEKGFEELPIVKIVEEQDWEVAESTDEHILLEGHPSYLHKIIGRKHSVEFEKVEKTENEETVIFRRNGQDFEKIHSEIEETEDGCKIEETGVSLKRVTPAYIELNLFLMPHLKETVKEVWDGDVKLIDETYSYGLSKFEL